MEYVQCIGTYRVANRTASFFPTLRNWIFKGAKIDRRRLHFFIGRTALGLSLGLSLGPGCHAQAAPEVDARPLPDLSTLMKEVEDHEKTSETLIKDYMYTESATETELDGHGNPKKTESTDAEIFYVDGIRLRRVLRRNGKELSPEDQRKEKERIDKHIAKIREERAKGSSGRPKGEYEVTFARFLELGSFSNERRVTLGGRSTIAVDYTGDPKAKTRNPLENAIHEMAGTVWVDEQDHAMVRAEGRFIHSFKIGGGLLVNVAEGTSFVADSRQINGEVWLPSSFSAQGSARAFVFFNLRGKFTGTNRNFHKFKASSTILPGVQEVDTAPDGDGKHSVPASGQDATAGSPPSAPIQQR